MAKPWYLQPLVLAGIGGTIIGLVLLFTIVSGSDFGLKPASSAGIGDDVVVEHVTGNAVDVDGTSFFERGRFAAVGRVFSVTKQDGLQTITLVFGDQARNAGAKLIARSGKVGIQNGLGNFTASPSAKITLVDVVGTIDGDIERGSIVSLIGQWGDMEGGANSNPATHSYVVCINGYRSGL